MKLINKKSVVFKIVTGYSLIAAVAVATTLFGLFLNKKSRDYDSKITQNYYPLLMNIKDLSALVMESNKLINNWIYQPNEEEKARLHDVHTTELNAIIAQWNKHEGSSYIDRSVLENTKQLFEQQQKIAGILKTDDDYADDEKVDNALTILDGAAAKAYTELLKQIESQSISLNALLKSADETKANYSMYQLWMLVGSIVLITFILITAAIIIHKSVTLPIKRFKDYVIDLSKGRFPKIQTNKVDDEIGEMEDAISEMIEGLKSKADFAENIGKGNYNYEFTLLSDEDTMGMSLLQMKENLKKNAIEDEKRNWGNIGLAQMGDILRDTNADEEQLYDKIIRFCVTYLKANQGALFLKKDNEDVLYMAACYAYNRKKFINKEVAEGEGLVGQAYLEKDSIFLTEIPQSYIKITSGLGEALPQCVFIVPLMHNDAVMGVLEIASFHVLEQYEREFSIKLAETVASTISSIKINSQTKKLLLESQELTEQMRSQEEEIRQNMEEMMATQEETNRRIVEYEETIREKEAFINSLTRLEKV